MVRTLPPAIILLLLSLVSTTLGFLSGMLFLHEEQSDRTPITFVPDQTPHIPTLRIEEVREGTLFGYLLTSDLRILLPDASFTFTRGTHVALPLGSLLPAPKDADTGCPYVASKSSTIFHEATSPSGKRIKKENRRCFGSVEEARNAGFAPSKALLPKLSSS